LDSRVGLKKSDAEMVVKTPWPVANEIWRRFREAWTELETRWGRSIVLQAEPQVNGETIILEFPLLERKRTQREKTPRGNTFVKPKPLEPNAISKPGVAVGLKPELKSRQQAGTADESKKTEENRPALGSVTNSPDLVIEPTTTPDVNPQKQNSGRGRSRRRRGKGGRSPEKNESLNSAIEKKVEAIQDESQPGSSAQSGAAVL
jgi:hypothetical protein